MEEVRMELNKEEQKEALALYSHLKEHPEVIHAPYRPGEPMCKICKKTAKDILGDMRENNKRTLSDKTMCIEEVHKMYSDMTQIEAINFDKDLLFDVDVQEAIKRYLSIVNNKSISEGADMNRIAVEIFGKTYKGRK